MYARKPPFFTKKRKKLFHNHPFKHNVQKKAYICKASNKDLYTIQVLDGLRAIKTHHSPLP